MPLEGAKARRIIKAVLANMDNWTLRVGAIADNCEPGEKHAALSLQRDLIQAGQSLRRLADLDGE